VICIRETHLSALKCMSTLWILLLKLIYLKKDKKKYKDTNAHIATIMGVLNPSV